MPNKEVFCSKLNIKNITDIDFRHEKRLFKEFNIKNVGEYHDLYVKSDTLLLLEVFKNFLNNCVEIYQLDPAHFASGPGLA